MTGVQTCALPISLEVGESDLIIVNYIPNVTGEVSDQIILTTNDPEIGRASCRERV